MANDDNPPAPLSQMAAGLSPIESENVVAPKNLLKTRTQKPREIWVSSLRPQRTPPPSTLGGGASPEDFRLSGSHASFDACAVLHFHALGLLGVFCSALRSRTAKRGLPSASSFG